MERPKEERKGITLAGNILVDVVKNIDCYPQKGMLCNISSVLMSVGGCVPNTGINLVKIDPMLPVSVLGCVGDDEYGQYALAQLGRYGIGTEKIVVSEAAPTSFSDVMSLPTGERTFFHARGANAEFCPEHVKVDELTCRILHIGYLLLLDRFDGPDGEYGTVMARFLHQVQERGICTSIDTVSDSSGDYPGKIIPALKYCDYVIINEIECCGIWGYSPRGEDGTLRVEVVKDAMERTLELGVREKVIVHSKEAGFCLSRDGSFTEIASLDIPKEAIKGSVGAGDAFCAGALYGIYQGWEDRKMLEFASGAAACNLFAQNAVDGMRTKEEILELMQTLPRKTFLEKGEEIC